MRRSCKFRRVGKTQDYCNIIILLTAKYIAYKLSLMEPEKLTVLINAMFIEIERLLPVYLNNKEDERIANGNCAACILMSRV